MNKPLVLRKVGNSLTLTVSELAKDLGLGEGDKVFAVRTPRGFEITPYDSDFETAVEAARNFMRKYPNAMKKLAE
ncbi:MAG: AbrB/MazE/SpoVT family DNA-binding domain-containing protein [Alphaproteobacteria bacterium]|nr:AbrB/MazE/SpoVT family DNA-binding domain-containing protein [Alphaproteobacteria bacterium]